MDDKDILNEGSGNQEKIELKWWEKKQGISLYQKKNQSKVEKQKKEKRELKRQLAEQAKGCPCKEA